MDLKRAQYQPNAWTCGPAALRHGMLWYDPEHVPSVQALEAQCSKGCLCHEGVIHGGQCEHGLAGAAKENDFRLDCHYATTSHEAYRQIRYWLDEAPILVCVDHYAHWLTVVRATGRHVFVLDSSRDGDLYRRLTWHQLFRRLAYGLPNEVSFHFYPLIQL